jgi:small GTP-binding protein
MESTGEAMSEKKSFNYDVFISHSSKDKPVIRKLAKRLKIDGLRVWLDEWVIQPGDMIGLKIEQGLEQSRTLILAMSKAAFQSEWVTLERHTMMFRDPTNKDRRFIPLLIEDCTVPDIIAQFAYIDWREKVEKTYVKLLSACRGEETREIKPASSKEKVIEASKVLRGHENYVNDVTVTPDGKRVVSCSNDKTLKVWDLESLRCLATLEGHKEKVQGIALTHDGKWVVSCSNDRTIKVWSLKSLQCLTTLKGHKNFVYIVVPIPDSKRIISGSHDCTLKVWDIESGQCLSTLEGHTGYIGFNAVSVTPDGKRVVTGASDQTLKVWDIESGQCLSTFKGHNSSIKGVAITPDGKHVVSGSADQTLKVWDIDSGHCLSTFEGHTSTVWVVSLTSDGKRVVSGSRDLTLKVWELESGQCLATLKGHKDEVIGLDITQDCKRVVSASEDKTIRIWELPESDIGINSSLSSRYTNAKVVLVGESGVGKTGLAIRLAEERWEVTDSTHGMTVWPLSLPVVEAAGMEREVWLWDFAGQPDYRLIHQLFMDETALALMTIDPQKDNPFDSLGHWEKALASAVKHDPAKLLVAGRCDRGGVTVSRSKLEQYCNAKGYSNFIDTAAKTGEGCDKLKELISEHIPWDRLPWTATTRLFKTLKDAIIHIKEEGIVLTRVTELRQRMQLELKEETIEEDDLRAVVGLLAGQGIVQKLDFGDFVLLQPEQINNYASTVVRSVRENIDEIGCISERDVLDANIDFKDMPRLPEADEKILLRAMLQTFIDRSLCLREETAVGTQLVFPYYYRQDRPEILEHPNVFLTYGFTGMPEEIYTTLVVRLCYTPTFSKDQLWKDAADFKTHGGKRMGLQMFDNTGDGAKIKVYFEADVPVDTQVSFIKYIHQHLQNRAKEVTRVRSYVCPHCDTPLENRKAIKKRLEKGFKDIICGVCEERVTLIDLIEKKFASGKFLRAVQEMDALAQVNLDNESRELILVGHAFTTAGEAGQIFRPVPNSDWGIDGEIEFKNLEGEASGKRVYLQLKSGDSYIYNRKRDDKQIFTIKNPRHAEYWQAHEYLVMLVIRTSDGAIRWMNVSDYLKKHGIKTKQIEFEGQPFTALNVSRLRDKLLGIGIES